MLPTDLSAETGVPPLTNAVEGTAEAGFPDDIAPRPEDYVFLKRRPSAFYGTGVAELRHMCAAVSPLQQHSLTTTHTRSRLKASRTLVSTPRLVAPPPMMIVSRRRLSRLFRRLFLEQLTALHATGRLRFFGDHAHLAERRAFTAYLAPLRKTEWVVYSKRPFGGPEAVLAYLSLYTHRIAISNSRLVAFDDTGVTFKWKDYRARGRERAKLMTLAIDEFIRRFLIHVLPGGFHRIRYYGLLANGGRAENIARARRLLNASAPQVAHSDAGGAEQQSLSHPCPCCGGRMIVIETFARGGTPRYRPTVPNPIDSS
jgi:hypothetical protein